MNRYIRNHQDFWSGVFFTVCGGAAVVLARNYPLGTASRMGPGYFPTLLGGLLLLIGVIITVRAMRHAGERVHPILSRPLVLVLAAMLGFGAALKFLGLVPAIAALVAVSSAAGAEFRRREVAISATLLCALSVGLFVWGLGLPLTLFGAE